MRHNMTLLPLNEAATTGDGVLTPNDAVQVVEEILPAQNKSYQLGLKLKLQPHQVENIHSTYANAEERLLRIVILFLNQVDPKPTWRVIVDALKSPLVNLPHLAREVETAHFPDTTSTPFTGKIIVLRFHTCLSVQCLPLRVQSSLPSLHHQSCLLLPLVMSCHVHVTDQ